MIVAALVIVKYSRDSKSKSNSLPRSTITSQEQPISSLPTVEHDIFISYASEDKPIADAICNTLESQRIRCWISPRDILPGLKYQEAIIDAIDKSSIMVLVFSSHSNTSPHVLSEVTEAMSKEVIIIPFRIEDVLPSKAMKYLINVPHWLDAITPPLEKHIDELSKTIHVIVNQKKSTQPDQE